MVYSVSKFRQTRGPLVFCALRRIEIKILSEVFMKSMTKRMGAVIAVSALAVTTAAAGTGMLIRSNVNAVAE